MMDSSDGDEVDINSGSVVVGVVGGVGVVESWETRAEQLFKHCDRECKGFITKRDLQRLWGELPLGPDELEGVFDSLDTDHNGFLSLQEFTDGFGTHLGLVIEFRADTPSSCGENNSEEEPRGGGGGVVGHNGSSGGGGGGEVITSTQLDDLLNLLANQDLESNSAVVESVWREVCGGGGGGPRKDKAAKAQQEKDPGKERQEEAADGEVRMGKLVAALLQELCKVRSEHTQLEALLVTKTEQFNKQVSRLYEDLESELSGETTRVVKEHTMRDARARAVLEQEVAARDAALEALEEEQQELRERVQQVAAAEVAARQENAHLIAQVNRLEEELVQREVDLIELTTSLDTYKKNTNNEKRLRAQHAFKVSEGIARERESLVSQLDLLRTINSQLRDEQDQYVSYSSTTSASGPLIRDTSTPPGQISRDNTSPPGPLSLDDTYPSSTPPPTHLPQLHFTLQTSAVQATRLLSDLEHDDDYFQAAEVKVEDSRSESPCMPYHEVSLFQELLHSPPVCATCGGTLTTQITQSTEQTDWASKEDRSIQTNPSHHTTTLLVHTIHHTSIRLHHITHHTHHTRRTYHTYLYLTVGGYNDDGESGVTHTRSDGNDCMDRSGDLVDDGVGSDGVSFESGEYGPRMSNYRDDNDRRGAYGVGSYSRDDSGCVDGDRIGDCGDSGGEQKSDCGWDGDCSEGIVKGTDESRLACVNEASTSKDWEKRSNSSDVWSECTEEQPDGKQKHTTQQQDEKLREESEGEECREADGKWKEQNIMKEKQEEQWVEETNERKIQEQGEEEGEEKEEEMTGKSERQRAATQKLRTMTKRVRIATTEDEIIEDRIIGESQQEPEVTENISIIPTTPTLITSPLLHRYPHKQEEEPVGESNHNEEDTGICEAATETLLYRPSRMFKIVFIGNSGVGKTSFIHRASTGQYVANTSTTVGVDYRTLELGVGSVLGVFQLWDTAGQERFRSITRQYYRNADAVVVMYDVSSESSFLSVLDWISSVKETATEELLVAVIGNKVDLHQSRAVPLDLALELVRDEGCLVREASAATGCGVREVMVDITTALLTTTTGQPLTSSSSAPLSLHQPFMNKLCCK
ncbi:hypothetical protein Pmani_025543 [Petrolisthes manimaculis]|uniref:EF-hand domain-containing protein n=1 Tax=Petrolisthes manimaculis TaxID=1843537 RepID=A0AAE1TXJ9_9EUCA|nr:hypothetical protein Pmani_025543 [Petrolisthes manimaculis]